LRVPASGALTGYGFADRAAAALTGRQAGGTAVGQPPTCSRADLPRSRNVREENTRGAFVHA
jgi:hypothetical protein